MEVRPFGLWPSPLSPDDLAASKRFRDLAWDSDEAVVASEKKVGKILTLIAASRDYQFA